jgi:hypothetical protein
MIIRDTVSRFSTFQFPPWAGGEEKESGRAGGKMKNRPFNPMPERGKILRSQDFILRRDCIMPEFYSHSLAVCCGMKG